MDGTYYFKIDDYIKHAPNIQKINWFDLPNTMYLLIEENSKEKIRSIRKILSEFGKDFKLNKRINGVLVSTKKGILPMAFPINLYQKSYCELYALMISEGSYRTEFSLNVPEEEFHGIFENSLKQLISSKVIIKKDKNNACKRSRAPVILKNMIPIPNHLPKLLFMNKEFAKEYLRIAFEAEGCPIYNLKESKKYIKLSRNSNVSDLFNEKNLPLEKRIFIKEIRTRFNKEYQKLVSNPDALILGEHLLLKYLFDIDSTLKIESIRLNSLGNRKGKISVKWVLYVYSGEDIKKFNEKIGFIIDKKRKKCGEMMRHIPSRKKQYFSLQIMKKIQKNNIFVAKDFNKEMRELGYVSPQKFIWDYCKNKKVIKRIGNGKYKLLID